MTALAIPDADHNEICKFKRKDGAYLLIVDRLASLRKALLAVSDKTQASFVDARPASSTLQRSEALQRIGQNNPPTVGTFSEMFIVSSTGCSHSGDFESPCVKLEKLDSLTQSGYKGLRGPRSLGSKITDTLPRKPNESYETRWRLYIYCPPCLYHLHVALAICAHIVGFRGIIRVDDRLPVSCCPATETLRRVTELEALLTNIEREWMEESVFTRSWISSHFDIPWLQRRKLIGSTAAGTESFSLKSYLQQERDDPRCSAIIVSAPVSTCERLLRLLPGLTEVAIMDGVVYKVRQSSDMSSWDLNVFSSI